MGFMLPLALGVGGAIAGKALGGGSKKVKNGSIKDPATAARAAASGFNAGDTLYDSGRYANDKSMQLTRDIWDNASSPMRSFLRGDGLNASSPTGVYKLGYDNTVRQGEREFNNAMTSGIAEANNRGYGPDVSMSLDNIRKNALVRAGMKQGAFTNAVTQQHQEALNNFWGANKLATDTAGTLGSKGTADLSSAGATYTNLYGHAMGNPNPSQWPGIVGSALNAGGTVGAASVANK